MEALIERLGNVLGRARAQEVPVYYAQHHNPDGFPAFGSPEWQLIPQLGPQNKEVIIHKTTPNIFLNTTLHEQLQHNKIKRLITGGIQTVDCMDTTCRRTFSSGYEIILIKDSHTTFDTPILKAEQVIAHHNQIIENWFGKVLAAEEIKF